MRGTVTLLGVLLIFAGIAAELIWVGHWIAGLCIVVLLLGGTTVKSK